MSSPQVPTEHGGTAFVLGGGGVLGAAEVGMLQALFEHDVRPDLIVGTSVGAINGALVAADPGPSAVDQLRSPRSWPRAPSTMPARSGWPRSRGWRPPPSARCSPAPGCRG